MSSDRHIKYEITGFYSTYIYIHDDDDNKVCFHYSILGDLIAELKKVEQICVDSWKKINEKKLNKCKFSEYTERQVDETLKAPYYSYGNLLKRCKCDNCLKEKEELEKINEKNINKPI